MSISIPPPILAAARGDPKSPAVAGYFVALLAQRQIPLSTSPADYPDDVFEVFRRLLGEQPMPALEALVQRFAELGLSR